MKTLTTDSFCDLVELSDVRLSPDGSQVVFVSATVDRAGNAYQRCIWGQSLSTDGQAGPWTASNKDSMPRWSPDGAWLAFLSGRDDKPKIMILPARGEARAVVSHANGIGSFEWSPSGAQMAFLAAVRADERAAEDAPATSAGSLPAFEAKQEKERKEHAEKERLDPRTITRVPYRSGTSYIEDRWQHIYVADVPADFVTPAAGKPRRITGSDVSYSQPTWSRDGSALFSTLTREPENARLYAYHDVVRLSRDGASEPVRLTSAGHSCFDTRISPDGKWVAYLRTGETRLGHHPTTLAIVPAAGGDPIDLTASFDRDVMGFVWGHDSETIYFTVERDAAVNLWRVSVPSAIPLEAELRSANIPTAIRGRLVDDLELSKRLIGALRRVGVRTVGELQAFQEQGGVLPDETEIRHEQLTSGAQEILSFDVDATGRIVFIASTPEDPSVLFVRESGGAVRALYTPNQGGLDGVTLGRVESVTYASDEHTIQGWIVTPPDFEPGKRYPLVVQIHGGPHLQWTASTASIWHEFQSMAARGYVVFYCNPRGSRGYGEAFTSANWKDWGDGPMRDVMRGMDLVIARGIIAEDSLAITGGSYGGYLSAWIIGHTDRFRAAVSQRGVYNFLSMRNTSDIPVFVDFETGLTPWDDAKALWEMSPLAHAPNINTPLMIEHSELDYRVPVEQGEQLFQALSVLKKPVEFVRYPREGHELSRSGEPKHRIERLNRIIGWFDRHCRP